MFEINESIAYLIGLLIGKGYIYEDENRISIEFPFTTSTVQGIARCPLCSSLATKPRGVPNPEKKLQCKNTECKNSLKPSINPSVKKEYDQGESLKKSIPNIIIPFLKKGITLESSIVSSGNFSQLVLTIEQDLHIFLKKIFFPDRSFSSFEIPDEMATIKFNHKIELINGLLDTIGFLNAGNWFDDYQNEINGKFFQRQRVYFEIVARNYKLPVSIDNYLREHFKIPIQTIDWSHPNIRDGKLSYYSKNDKKGACGKENQVKTYPEYLEQFTIRVSSKAELFQELLDFNKWVGFQHKGQDWSEDDWFPPKKIRQIKPNHPWESDNSLHPLARGHVEKFWQINLKMGCKFLREYKKNADNEKLFEITGEIGCHSKPEEEIKRFKETAKKKFDNHHNKIQIKQKKETKNKKKGKKEEETYPVLTDWLKDHISSKTSNNAYAFDTHNQTIYHFSLQNEDYFNNYADLKLEEMTIRPDIIGFEEAATEFYFIESKVTPINLTNIGQTIGYCQVADPEEAFLISTEDLSRSVIRAISHNRDILKFGKNKEIKFAKLTNDRVKEITV